MTTSILDQTTTSLPLTSAADCGAQDPPRSSTGGPLTTASGEDPRESLHSGLDVLGLRISEPARTRSNALPSFVETYSKIHFALQSENLTTKLIYQFWFEWCQALHRLSLPPRHFKALEGASDAAFLFAFRGEYEASAYDLRRNALYAIAVARK